MSVAVHARLQSPSAYRAGPQTRSWRPRNVWWGSKKGEGKRHHDSSDEGSYDDISESDTNDSSSEPLEEDDMTDSSETDDSDAESDTEGADSSKEESAEDDVVTDNDGEDDDGSKNVCCPIDTWEALAHMNKAMALFI
ncbi:hypothetical protein HOLleu_43640 [Holothuria leucospilota]|uniref:Uncharacterized protein n=1 Tax=Holothuria leucospilota TaxID=206669 RepID=A0A9Q1BBG2_HOLLE|nr:hypothetical protein HOLleu_43640 [Holothuria leucospilota]